MNTIWQFATWLWKITIVDREIMDLLYMGHVRYFKSPAANFNDFGGRPKSERPF